MRRSRPAGRAPAWTVVTGHGEVPARSHRTTNSAASTENLPVRVDRRLQAAGSIRTVRLPSEADCESGDRNGPQGPGNILARCWAYSTKINPENGTSSLHSICGGH